MAKDPNKEPEIASMFGDYNYNRAKVEGLWKKAGRSFKKFLIKFHKEEKKKK